MSTTPNEELPVLTVYLIRVPDNAIQVKTYDLRTMSLYAAVADALRSVVTTANARSASLTIEYENDTV